jgi:hypothetical protein
MGVVAGLFQPAQIENLDLVPRQFGAIEIYLRIDFAEPGLSAPHDFREGKGLIVLRYEQREPGPLAADPADPSLSNHRLDLLDGFRASGRSRRLVC